MRYRDSVDPVRRAETYSDDNAAYFRITLHECVGRLKRWRSDVV